VNGELKRCDVQTSVSNFTRIAITSSLPDGAVLALGTTNMRPLADGMAVKSVNP